jgi:hypothetical protein
MIVIFGGLFGALLCGAVGVGINWTISGEFATNATIVRWFIFIGILMGVRAASHSREFNAA